MTLTLRNTALTACILLALAYTCFTVRSFQAMRLSSSLDVASLQRAIGLEPGNASDQDLLCRFLLFDRQDAAAATPACERATQLNPYDSAAWLDLALAYYTRGAEADQRRAILAAIAVDPKTPDVAWQAANFFLTQGETAQAFRQFAVAMHGDPNRIGPSLAASWRATHDVNAILAILPPDPDAYLQFIRLLMANNQWEGAHQVWSAMVLLKAPLDYRRALFYVDAQLQQRNPSRAVEAWNQLAARSPILHAYTGGVNLVVNGGFDQEILNAGFDWHYEPRGGSTPSLDVGEFHSPGRSLLISYRGNGGDAGFFQYVPVKPNTQYTLSAWTKSEKLETANGPRVSVYGGYDGKLYAQTPETTDTTPWHRLATTFQTGPETEIVVIRLSRDPADTIIKGKFWVDDVDLRAATPSALREK